MGGRPHRWFPGAQRVPVVGDDTVAGVQSMAFIGGPPIVHRVQGALTVAARRPPSPRPSLVMWLSIFSDQYIRRTPRSDQIVVNASGRPRRMSAASRLPAAVADGDVVVFARRPAILGWKTSITSVIVKQGLIDLPGLEGAMGVREGDRTGARPTLMGVQRGSPNGSRQGTSGMTSSPRSRQWAISSARYPVKKEAAVPVSKWMEFLAQPNIFWTSSARSG